MAEIHRDRAEALYRRSSGYRGGGHVLIDPTGSFIEVNHAVLTQRLSDDLQRAAGYVESIMPVAPPGSVSVSSRYEPSRELGGDCFDYARIDDDHLMVYPIDVCGQGIEPALLAASVQNVFCSGTFATEILFDPSTIAADPAFQDDASLIQLRFD